MTQHTKKYSQHGFTLVELMLALSFIAFIMLFTIFATIQIMRSYSKGITIKEINQSSRDIITDMSTVIRNASPSAFDFTQIPFGRACFGSVSYVWNVQGGTNNTYTDGSPIALARANDPSSALCKTPLPQVDKTTSTPLLGNLIWVQKINFDSTPDKNATTISINLSTNGNNAPTFNDPALGLVCAGDQPYCSVANFSTTVTSRTGGR